MRKSPKISTFGNVLCDEVFEVSSVQAAVLVNIHVPEKYVQCEAIRSEQFENGQVFISLQLMKNTLIQVPSKKKKKNRYTNTDE